MEKSIKKKKRKRKKQVWRQKRVRGRRIGAEERKKDLRNSPFEHYRAPCPSCARLRVRELVQTRGRVILRSPYFNAKMGEKSLFSRLYKKKVFLSRKHPALNTRENYENGDCQGGRARPLTLKNRNTTRIVKIYMKMLLIN